MTDSEDRKTSQEADRNAGLQALWFLLSAAVGIDDESESARLVATGLPSIVGCSFAALAVERPDGSSWDVRTGGASGAMSNEWVEAFVAEIPALGDRALVAGRLVLSGGDEVPTALQQAGVEALTAVPVRTTGGFNGLIMIGWPAGASDQVEESGATLLSAFATPLAVGFENRRLRTSLEAMVARRTEQLKQRAVELDEANRETQRLLDLTNAVVGTEDRQKLFTEMSSALDAFVAHDRAVLMSYQEESESLEVFALAGPEVAALDAVGRQIDREGSYAWQALESAEPILVDDLAAQSTTPLHEDLVEEAVRSLLLVPLIVRTKRLGVLAVAARSAGQYSTDDATRLARVATQVALALEKLLAFEEIRSLQQQLQSENVYLREEIRIEHDFEDIVGSSTAIVEVERAIETVAPTDASVLITGETGTGKELIARALHNLSKRSDRALVKVNCAAIPEGLVESELFGHERGAFTGALARKIGRFQLANYGTIFLDEIGELPLDLQSKLLRVLQEGEFERLGSAETKTVDVRVIAATNRDLGKEVAEGRFRSDLYYRLNVFPIEVPPLRERGDDVRLLVSHFAEKFGQEFDRNVEGVPRATMDRLVAYDWPGNVRELRNVIERAVILSPGEDLELGSWFQSVGVDGPAARTTRLDDVQREHIVQILEMTRWKVSGPGGAAELLGLKPTTLNHRMQKLGIERPDR